MRIRSKGVGLFATVALIVSACSSAATAVPTVAPTVAPTAAPTAAAPSTAASAAPSTAATPAPSFAQMPNLKIGVVTDIGTLDDKDYNEFSYKGAQAGATAIGVTDPVPSIVPKDASEYAADIDQFVNQQFDVIVTVGFNLTTPTVDAAHKNPKIRFVGVDQSPVCVTPTGEPDPTFACKGVAATALPELHSLHFAEDQAGYLAGIVAAYADKGAPSPTGMIGAIGGINLCAPCVRYIQGYALGAASVNPSISVKTAYVTHDFSNAASTTRPAARRSPSRSSRPTSRTSCSRSPARPATASSRPPAPPTSTASASTSTSGNRSARRPTRASSPALRSTLNRPSSRQSPASPPATSPRATVLFNAKNDGISAADFHDKASLFGPEVTTALNTALAAMQAGTLVTCPPAPACGTYTPTP